MCVCVGVCVFVTLWEMTRTWFSETCVFICTHKHCASICTHEHCSKWQECDYPKYVCLCIHKHCAYVGTQKICGKWWEHDFQNACVLVYVHTTLFMHMYTQILCVYVHTNIWHDDSVILQNVIELLRMESRLKDDMDQWLEGVSSRCWELNQAFCKSAHALLPASAMVSASL